MVDPSAPKKRQRASRSQAKAAAGSVLPQPPEPVRLYVSLDGDDKLDGSSPRQRGKAGPFKTLDRAQREVRAIKRQNKGRLPAPVRVELAGGTYVLSKPWTLEPRDSGNPAETWWSKILAPAHDVTWAAAPGEQPIVSGGKRITGWKEGQVHGKRALVAPAPAVKRGSWFFRQLWVNGRRAQRTRLPEKGLYRIAELPDGVWEGEGHTPLFIGQDNFGYAEGDIQPWRNIQDVEFVALHYWIESRIPFESVDPSTRMARLQWKSRMRLSDDHSRGLAPYYIENVFEALAKPGQWYLDREAGKVYYLPRDGESADTIDAWAPALDHVLRLAGDSAEDQWVEYVNFEGITFSHTEWTSPDPNRKVTPQAACNVPGALRFEAARECRMTGCRVEHVGTYGIELVEHSREIEIAHCAITDVGGGGVKVWHTLPRDTPPIAPGTENRHLPERLQNAGCRRITVRDCEISDGGYRYHQAVGVLIGKCIGVKVLHNHIHNFDYTGISVGWTWGYAEGDAYGHIIEHNHVHDIGRGMLSDMGGIYCLGVQPGTRIRYNVFHDVESRGYGGWAIYTDEGSTDILIECNLAFRTKSQGFHQHYGRNNVIRNNIFALGREAQVARSRLEHHNSFTFERNIILADNESGEVFVGDWRQANAVLRNNLYHHASGKPLRFTGGSLKDWQAKGLDVGSRIGDPLFRNVKRNDYRLKPGSPAEKLGFVPWDMWDVGPRKPEDVAEDVRS